MDVVDAFVGAGGDNAVCEEIFAVGILPAVINSGECHDVVVGSVDKMRSFNLVFGLPFVETVAGDNASSSLKRLGKGRLFGNSLASSVDHFVACFGIFCPRGNQSPPKCCNYGNLVTSDCHYWHKHPWRDIQYRFDGAGVADDRLEVFFQIDGGRNQFISSAHDLRLVGQVVGDGRNNPDFLDMGIVHVPIFATFAN